MGKGTATASNQDKWSMMIARYPYLILFLIGSIDFRALVGNVKEIDVV
jgi:hypothetical protein